MADHEPPPLDDVDETGPDTKEEEESEDNIFGTPKLEAKPAPSQPAPPKGKYGHVKKVGVPLTLFLYR